MRDLFHHSETTARRAMKEGGSKYWRVFLADGEIVYLNAQRAAVEGGALVFYRGRSIKDDDGEQTWEETDEVVTAFGPGEWRYVASASVFDGTEVNWDHHLVPEEPEGEG